MKYFILVSILIVFIGYFAYEKNQTYKYIVDQKELVPLDFPEILGEPILGHFPAENSYKKYVVHIWATWCPTCKVDMPELINIIKANPHAFFYMVSIKSDLKLIKKMFSKYSDLPQNLVFIEDKKQLIKNHLKTYKVPESHIFDERKVYQERIIGEDIVSLKMKKALRSNMK